MTEDQKCLGSQHLQPVLMALTPWPIVCLCTTASSKGCPDCKASSRGKISKIIKIIKLSKAPFSAEPS